MNEKPPTKKTSPILRRLAYFTFWIALILAFGMLATAQASQYADLQNELARIHAETERAELEHERLLRQQQFIGTDAYIEQQARDRLGLVLPTELIFINVGW